MVERCFSSYVNGGSNGLSLVSSDKEIFGGEKMTIKLTGLQKLRLMIGGRVFVGMKKKVGWVGSRPAYVFRCPDHGLVESFTHGFDRLLICSECIKI